VRNLIPLFKCEICIKHTGLPFFPQTKKCWVDIIPKFSYNLVLKDEIMLTVEKILDQNPFIDHNPLVLYRDFESHLRPMNEVVTRSDRQRSILCQVTCLASSAIPFGVTYLIDAREFKNSALIGVALGILGALFVHRSLKSIPPIFSHHGYHRAILWGTPKNGVCVVFPSPQNANYWRLWSDYLQQDVAYTREYQIRSLLVSLCHSFCSATIIFGFGMNPLFPRWGGTTFGAVCAYNVTRLATSSFS